MDGRSSLANALEINLRLLNMLCIGPNMDFNFSTNNFDWCMDLAEVDDNDNRSFRVVFQLDLKHPTGKFVFSADDVWFDADDWGKFEAGLENWPNSDESIIALADMSQYITFSLKNDVTEMTASISVCEPLADGHDARLHFKNRIDRDGKFLSRMRDCFSNWPKHW